jgi:hypothetical protein
MKSQQKEWSWFYLVYGTLGGGLLGILGGAVCGYCGFAVTEYRASVGQEAIMLATGWGCPAGLVLGFFVGLILTWIQRRM